MSDSATHAQMPDGDDAETWRQLTERYSPFIHYCLRGHSVPLQDADDLVQDVLAVVVRRLPDFRAGLTCSALLAWLRKTTHNCVRDFRRARRKCPVAVGGDEFQTMLAQRQEPDSDLKRQWNEEHRQHLVQRLIDRVRPRVTAGTLRAFERVALDGKSTSEVAAELGITINAVCIAKTRVISYMRQDCQDLELSL